jgi:hypothetical protein
MSAAGTGTRIGTGKRGSGKSRLIQANLFLLSQQRSGESPASFQFCEFNL